MLRRIHDPDKGASFVEYAAVIALVGVIIAALLVAGVPRQITDGIAAAVDGALNGEGADPGTGDPGAPGTGEPGAPGADEPGAGEQGAEEPGASEPGAPGSEGSEFPEGSGPEGEGSGFPESGDPDASEGGTGDGSGSPGAVETETVPYNPEEDTGGVTPAVWDGGDDFTVQQTLSWGEAWDWATGGRDAFTFEDNGDYNWDCGWVFHYFCVAGGGLAQGGSEVLEDAKGAVCHVHLCSHDDFKETWSGTWDGVVGIWEDPWGSVGAMWDDFWETAERNDENLDGDDSFVKNTGYWLTQIPGTVLKPFRFLGGNGRSSDRDGSSDQDGNDRDRDGAGCSNSFVPGTLVVLADGTAKPIELIQVGDRVLAADPGTGEQGPREVTHLILGGGDKTLVEVTVDDGSGDTASVTATDNHPFWVPDQGWTAAIDLEPGSWLQTSAGVWVQVDAVDAYTAVEQTVHNLTVEGLHTYYVLAGESSLLVHNSGPCPEIGPHETNGEPSTSKNLERTAQVGDDTWQFKTGHGFNREHTGPNNVKTDLRNTDLTPNQVEQSIVNDVYTHIDNGGTIPQVGTPGFRPYEGTVQVDGYSIGYRVSIKPDGAYSLATYFIRP